MQPAHLYDSAITVFSPDGRIYQVEYAREVVKRGSTVVGITAEDGVGFLAGRRDGSKLAIQDSVEKIFQIDNHIGAATCGLVADARVLVSAARVICARHRYSYGEDIDVQLLSREISDIMHQYTQSGGTRPFGVSMLVGGVHTRDKTRLYETDPSGAFIGYKASALGARRVPVMQALEQAFRPETGVQDAMRTAYKAIVSGADNQETSVEGALVTKDGFRRLAPDEIAALGRAT